MEAKYSPGQRFSVYSNDRMWFMTILYHEEVGDHLKYVYRYDEIFDGHQRE